LRCCSGLCLDYLCNGAGVVSFPWVFCGWELAFTGVDACALHSAGGFRTPSILAFLRCRLIVSNLPSSFFFFDVRCSRNATAPCHDPDWTPGTLQDWQNLGVLQALLAGTRQVEKTLRWLHCLLATFSLFFFLVVSFTK
jgi:hypothetical protein